MSYDIPEKRCFNLEDHPEHYWGEYADQKHCPGMPLPKTAEKGAEKLKARLPDER